MSRLNRKWLLWMVVLWLVCLDVGVAAASDRMQEGAAPWVQWLLEGIRSIEGIDVCGEPVPLGNPEVRERFEREMLLMLGDPAQVVLWLKRGARYFPEIESTLAERRLPSDLKFIPVIESAFLPHAGSSKGAVGHWQFISETGKRHGLNITADVDERRNPVAATRAALDYLTALYREFGAWSLAAAAYNMGEEGLRTEIFLQDCRDFYQLHLPQETQRYVLRLAAAKAILTRPERFGFVLKPEDLYPPLVTQQLKVELEQPVSVLLIARAARTSYKTIRDLNPEIRGYVLPSGFHALTLPPEGAAGFPERLKTMLIQAEGGSGNIHIVQKGETLSGIAKKYGIPVKALAILNRLDMNKTLVPGERLRLSPTAEPSSLR